MSAHDQTLTVRWQAYARERSIDKTLATWAVHQRFPMVPNPCEHLNYFSVASLRIHEEGFEILVDYGTVAAPRELVACVGETVTLSARIRNGARLLKHSIDAPISTQLFASSLSA